MAANEHLRNFASTVIKFFEAASEHAEKMLSAARPRTTNVLASINTLTSEEATQALSTITDEQRADLLRLQHEPAIARVLANDENDSPVLVYITRGSTPSLSIEGVKVASYRSPLGRLASLSTGAEEEMKLPGRTAWYSVKERASLRPFRSTDGWDAKETVLDIEGRGPVTIVSLRALVDAIPDNEAIDVLQDLLAEDAEGDNIRDGLLRSVISKMGLRDRPLLDQYQDEIYRLPIDSKLAIMGPPGSGKTTTLIKRLGLKLDWQFLDEDEQSVVNSSLAGAQGHAASWLMFTPNDLLKLYIKEAFARENIAAPDQRIRTWDEFRREIARQALGILQTATNTGAIMRSNPSLLDSRSVDFSTEWFEDFNTWQADQFWNDLSKHAQIIASDESTEISRIGENIKTVLGNESSSRKPSIFTKLIRVSDGLKDTASQLRIEVDKKIDSTLSEHLRSDSGIIDRLLTFISELEATEETSDDTDDGEEDEETRFKAGSKREGVEAYRRALRAQARGAASGRRPGAKSRNGKILQFLDTFTLNEDKAKEIGKFITALDSMRRFSNPIDAYLARIPRRYRVYRKLRQSEGVWYNDIQLTAHELDPLEVDLIILAMLKGASALISERQIRERLDGSRHQILQSIYGLRRNQIVVDEATDFSPIQLACMAELCDPTIRSFVACGDFNQRLTQWGSRSNAQLEWAVPKLDIRSILVTYRHSRQLNDFARKLIALSGDGEGHAKLPEHLASEGFDPAIGLSRSGEALITWLAERIFEIEQNSETLPAIAVLINDETHINELADALNERLEATQNIRCVACPKGQVRGQDDDVRIFDVKHIKGLEFEAVFFVDVDALAKQENDLFYRYLYVGSTRAATYLGFTCKSDSLPMELKSLENSFCNDWRGL